MGGGDRCPIGPEKATASAADQSVGGNFHPQTGRQEKIRGGDWLSFAGENKRKDHGGGVWLGGKAQLAAPVSQKKNGAHRVN